MTLARLARAGGATLALAAALASLGSPRPAAGQDPGSEAAPDPPPSPADATGDPTGWAAEDRRDVVVPPAPGAEAAAGEAPLPFEEEAPPTAASSPVPGARIQEVRGPQGAAWGEVGVTGADDAAQSVLAVAAELGFRLVATRVFALSIRWGLTAAATRVTGAVGGPGDEEAFEERPRRFEAGNPVLRGDVIGGGGDTSYRIGLAVAVPMASRPDAGDDVAGAARRQASALTHRAAAALRGWWSPWAWRPERVALALPARLVHRAGALRWSAELAAAALFPILGDRNAAVDVAVQGALGVGGDLGGGWSLGLRAHVVGGVAGEGQPETGTGLPDVQAALMPWVRARVTDGGYVGLRGVVLFGTTDGIGAGQGPTVGLLVNGGGGF